MQMSSVKANRKIWRVVLTGGPCGGKTTGQARLSTFFENLGWKVFRVPETANLLLAGGVNFAELSPASAEKFQENLLRTMLMIENTYFELAKSFEDRNVLVICDRGSMDASAFVSRDTWEQILARNSLDEVEIRDNRYNQVVHLVSAAKGAEAFYTLEQHASRREDLQLARERDTLAAEAWVGHPYVTIVDNGSDFETKINTLISHVAWSIGIDVGDRLLRGSRKVKFVVNGPLPKDELFPSFRDFEVVHTYLQVAQSTQQSRLRKRGRKGKWTYTHTIRKHVSGQVVEVKTPLTHRDYCTMILQQDPNHLGVYKTRRCFLHGNQYFQLDIYKKPCHQRCEGLMLLETYTTLDSDQLRERLPPFLNLGFEVTGDPAFSMFNLSLKEDWSKTSKLYSREASMISEAEPHGAKDRLHMRRSTNAEEASTNGNANGDMGDNMGGNGNMGDNE